MIYGWKHLTPDDERLFADEVIGDALSPMPRHLEIHPTNRCNAKCFFCFTESHRENQTLPWETLKRTLEEAAPQGLRYLRISGGGESLVYPQIDELLDLCQNLNLRIADLTTNGIVLERFAERLVEIGSDFIFISLNEPTPEHYASTMQIPEKNFHQAVAGVRALVGAREGAPEHKKPTIALQFFIWKENHRELRRMYDFGLSLGVDEIVIKTLTEVPPTARIAEADLPSLRERLLEIIQEDSRPGGCKLRFDLSHEADLNAFADKAQRERLPEGVTVGPDFIEHRPRRPYCMMPWYSATLAATGKVYPCCVLYEKPGKDMGDLNTQSLEEIWRGHRYQQFRKDFRRLMLLRGKMEFSPKHSAGIEPQCIHTFGCHMGFNLCSAGFYKTLSERLEKEIPAVERLQARSRDQILRWGHRIKNILCKG